jgi:hypothetical protein
MAAGKDADLQVPDSGPATLLMATFGVHAGSPSMTDKEGCLPDEYFKCVYCGSNGMLIYLRRLLT